MATRHGGWFELESGTQAIFIQADGAGDQREVKELRAELRQAQELGEAYARELAGMLVEGELRTEPPMQAAPREGTPRFEVLKSAAAAFERTLKGLAEGLRSDAQGTAKSTDAVELQQAMTRRANALTEAAAELSQIAECPIDEAKSGLDLAELARGVLSEFETRAARVGVELESRVPAQLGVRAAHRLLRLELRLLLSHAIAATPRGGVVRLSAIPSELGVIVAVEDGGPPIPEASRASVLRHSADPTSFGRPGGIALLAAHAAAAALGAELELREGARGSTEAWVTLPSVS
jgi:signal transduction histidine kinase